MLTVTGISASNKVYDGTTAATIDMSAAALVNVCSGDTVTLGTGGAVGHFVSKHVANNITIWITGLTLGGPDGGNYLLSSTAAPAAANITPAPVTVTASADNKVYDGNTSATVTLSVSGQYAPDVVTASAGSADFDTKDAGTGKLVTVHAITLGGASAGDYMVAAGAVTAHADITQAIVTVTAHGDDKVYDATPAATVSLTVHGQVAGDTVTASAGSAAFNSKDVGQDKTIVVTGITLAGASANNYTLGSTQATATADITPFALTVGNIQASAKVYDHTTAATIDMSDAVLVTVFSGDAVTLDATAAVGTFASKDVGQQILVTVAGLQLLGADHGNYALGANGATAHADIKAAPVTVTASGNTKVYDHTVAATVTLAVQGVLGGDSVTASADSAAFDTKDVGVVKTITITNIALGGADANDYVLVNPPATTTGTITPFGLTVANIHASDKVYDTTATATIDVSAASLANVFANDTVTLSTSGAAGNFSTMHVGTQTVTVTGLTLGGADAGDYVVGNASALATITPAAVTLDGSADNKVYDGTTSATVHLGVSSGVLANDVVTASAGSAAFDNPDVGTNKPVTINGIVMGGANGSDYTFANVPAPPAGITQAPLTVTADDKSMDPGGPVPALTYQVTGTLYGSDGLMGALATTATSSSPGGAYAITQGTLTAGSNYALTFVGGTLYVSGSSDTTPPAFTFVAQYYQQNHFIVTGYAIDSGGFADISALAVVITDQTGSVLPSSDYTVDVTLFSDHIELSFTIDVPLPATHTQWTMAISATDSQGNTGTSSVSFSS